MLDNYQSEDIKNYAISGIIIVLIIMLIAGSKGNIKLMYGRLSINDSIRDLANAVSVPLYLLFISLIKSIEEKKKKNLIMYIGIIFGTFVLLATLSRGAIIAIIAGLIVMFFMSKIPTQKKISYSIIIVSIAAIIIGYLSTNDLIRTERLFNNSNGLNGREEIWLTYLNELNRDTPTLLFGFGPGDVTRLNINDAYTHSLILDILFSYGIIGFIFFIILLLGIIWKAFKSKNATAMGIIVFALLTYSTHGVSTASAFYIMLGIAVQMFQNKKKKEKNIC